MVLVTFPRTKSNLLVIGCLAILLLLLMAAHVQYSLILNVAHADRRNREEFLSTSLRSFNGGFKGTILGVLPFFRPTPVVPPGPLESHLANLTIHYLNAAERPRMLAGVSVGEGD